MSSTSLINAAVGEYRIVDRLGEGGMGEVYRAVHTKIGRIVAIKLMNRASVSPEFFQRFLNEARIQACLNHPNIVTLYDFCEFDGRPCIIMEYIEGGTLADRIRSRGALSRNEAVPLFRAVVDALSYVHGQGIIHRDIKSTNIKITPAGEVKVLDFGIAKSGNSPSLTMTGGFVGTLQYISPEQFAGGQADARSDIWALGVLLYEMTTGMMPFDADSIGGLYEKINAAAYVPPSMRNARMPRELEPIIARCLRRNPAERYQTARDLLVDLERAWSTPTPPAMSAVAHQPIPVQSAQPVYTPPPAVYAPAQAQHPVSGPAPESSWSEPPTETWSLKWVLIVGAAAVVLALLGVGYLTMTGNEPQPSPTQPVQQPAQQTEPQTHPDQPAVQQAKAFTLEVSEGQAEVYKDGLKVGVTPYHFDAKPGEQVDVVLKRQGYQDKSVQMSVSENKKVYTFSMAKKE